MPTFETQINLSAFHKEHEKYYSKRPLEQATEIQKASNVLKTLAARWNQTQPGTQKNTNPYAGCEELNEISTIQHTGVLFMEGEGEPKEISDIKRDLNTMAEDLKKTGEWLDKAMESTWQESKQLIQNPQLAGVLGERYRIMSNDWQAATMSRLAANLIFRALEILGKVDFAPNAIRSDISTMKVFPEYLFSASELLDHSSDVTVDSSTLVHDNDKRWRVFRQRLEQLMAKEK